MADDIKVALDDSRKIAQHEAVKEEVRSEVNAEISLNANQLTEADQAKAKAVAANLKDKAIREVVGTENEIERARGVARVSQVVDYVFYLAYGIITLEIVLELLGARESSGFKQFIDTVSAPLLAPFRGLMADPSRGPFRLMLSYIIALVVYLLLHLAVNGALRLMVHKKTEV